MLKDFGLGFVEIKDISTQFTNLSEFFNTDLS